jgi:hypothetical protein
MNGKSSAGTQSAGAVLVQPETRTVPEVQAAEGEWLCAWCHSRVAHDRDRFSFDGKDEFIFSNPEKIKFEIILFSEICGCRQAGAPALEHTWFPGYAWSYCLCIECGQHLGWYYTGVNDFVGLIKARIVRAVYVRN